VSRPRLLAALDAAAPGQVTAVCAPAGHGKTLLLADWASRRPGEVAWVSLDADDDDDHRFWSAVLTALAGCAAVPADSPLRTVAVPLRPSRDPAFLATVVDALDPVASRVCLVLDDVHELGGAESRHGLAVLVRDRPPDLRLVLAGRIDPPLPMARMRVAGEIHEIRGDALRFSEAEAGELLVSADVPVRPEQLRLLVDQTAGWAAGLRLAALSLRDSDDPDRFLTDFVGNSRAISDYLVGEILARLPPESVDLLCLLSICDQVPAQLAAAVSGRPDAAGVLDALERDTSLVLSSGEGRVSYRVHPLLRSHLFADLRRRQPERIPVLHRRAAEWHAARGEFVEALGHARSAGDRDQVALLLRSNGGQLVADGLLGAVREVLDWLGDGWVADDVQLELLAALLDVEFGALGAADAHLARVDDVWPDDAGSELTAMGTWVRARRVGADGDATLMLTATDRLMATDGSSPAVAVWSSLDRASALLTAGRTDESEVIAAAALVRARSLGAPVLVAQGVTVLGAIAGLRGDLRRMSGLAAEADRAGRGTDWGSTGTAAFTASMRAYGALMRAEPAACLDLLRPVLAFYEHEPLPASNPVAVTTWALRGSALADLGHATEGLADLRRARTAAVGQPLAASAVALTALLEHGLATAANHPEQARAALHWVESSLAAGRGDAALMRAQRLDALSRPQAAAECLRPLLDHSSGVVVPWAVLAAWVLDCRLAVLEDHRARARRSLVRALALTDTMDALRPLVFGPEEVVDLLTRHLGSFGELDPVAVRVLGARQRLVVDGRPVALTERERAVLQLLPTPRSYEEIAGDLTVSYSTVKTHVRAIYGKLGVSSRRDAVDRARRHGVLRQPRSGDDVLD
jgi:LuxR family maltose regulon positive regulatory protein